MDTELMTKNLGMMLEELEYDFPAVEFTSSTCSDWFRVHCYPKGLTDADTIFSQTMHIVEDLHVNQYINRMEHILRNLIKEPQGETR